jgi:menaquinone-9 beta-reductase
MSGGREYDVAVVGASLAGSTVAALLGRAGARVALLESHADSCAFKRTCTHFIQASAAPLLERLGVLDVIERAGGVGRTHDIWTRYGWARSHELEQCGWNIRREKLDPLLRGIASSTEGVELMLGQTVVELHGDGVTARDRSGEERRIAAPLVVGADGRDSTVARLAEVPEKVRPNNRFAYWGYFRDLDAKSGIWLTEPTVAYCFPTDAGLKTLGCMTTKDRLPEFKADPEAAVREVFEGLPDGPSFDGTKLVGPMLGKLEIPNISRRVTAPGLALVGDAAMASDPLWGVGCGFALQSAEWLADALAEDSNLERALDAYRRTHRRRLAAHHAVTSDFSTGRPLNLGERLIFKAAACDPEVGRRMQLFGERWITPRELMTPRTLARVARASMRRGERPVGSVECQEHAESKSAQSALG